MQHLHPMKGAQAPGDLLDDAPHRLQRGLGLLDHPLRKGLSLDEFACDIEIVARSG